MGTFEKAGQRYVVPDDVVVDYTPDVRVEVDVEPVVEHIPPVVQRPRRRKGK